MTSMTMSQSFGQSSNQSHGDSALFGTLGEMMQSASRRIRRRNRRSRR